MFSVIDVCGGGGGGSESITLSYQVFCYFVCFCVLTCICRFEIKQPIEYLNTHHPAPKTLILSAGGGGGGEGGDARGKNVSGDPAHQHQYITVGVNTPSFTRWSRIALVRVR